MSNLWGRAAAASLAPAASPPLSRSFGAGAESACAADSLAERIQSQAANQSISPACAPSPSPMAAGGRPTAAVASSDEDALNCSCTFLHSVNCTARDGGGRGR